MEKFATFDLEIVKEIPEGEDWKNMRPVGVSCAAVLEHDRPLSTLFYHKDYALQPAAGAMTDAELNKLVNHMLMLQGEGYKIVTWNGLGFDFQILAEESGMHDEVSELAINHIDMMFHFLCVKGYPLALDTAAKGLGLAGKMEGMHGNLAPVMWASDNQQDRVKVLRYVHGDVLATLEVYERSLERGHISWLSRRNRINFMYLDMVDFGGWLSVKDCLRFIPEPDTSWMSDSLPRLQFYDWVTDAHERL